MKETLVTLAINIILNRIEKAIDLDEKHIHRWEVTKLIIEELILTLFSKKVGRKELLKSFWRENKSKIGVWFN